MPSPCEGMTVEGNIRTRRERDRDRSRDHSPRRRFRARHRHLVDHRSSPRRTWTDFLDSWRDGSRGLRAKALLVDVRAYPISTVYRRATRRRTAVTDSPSSTGPASGRVERADVTDCSTTNRDQLLKGRRRGTGQAGQPDTVRAGERGILRAGSPMARRISRWVSRGRLDGWPARPTDAFWRRMARMRDLRPGVRGWAAAARPAVHP